MSNQTKNTVVSFNGRGVPMLKFNFGAIPVVGIDMLITEIVNKFPGHAHAIIVALVYEKAALGLTAFEIIQKMGTRSHLAVNSIMSVLDVDFIEGTPIQNTVADILEALIGMYNTDKEFFKFPELVQDQVVAAPAPVTAVTAVEVKPVVEPVEKPAETPAPKPAMKEPAKAGAEEVSNSMKNVLVSNKNLVELITQLQTEVEGILTGGIDYDEPFLAAILKSEAGKKLSTLSLRDVVGEALIPKKMETTATLLLKKAGVVTPNELERKAGATALDILKGSPMIFEEIKSQLVKLTKVEVNFDNLEEVFANNNTELSVSEVTALFESVEGITPKVKAEEVDTAETSLGSAMRTAFKKGQAHHAVKKAK